MKERSSNFEILNLKYKLIWKSFIFNGKRKFYILVRIIKDISIKIIVDYNCYNVKV